MPLDASIIGGLQTPQFQSPLDQYSKALTMKSLLSRSELEDIQSRQAKQEFDDTQAIRTATNNHTMIDANGAPTVDQAGVLKDLANSPNPSLAPKAAMQFSQMNQQMQKQKLEMLYANISAGAQMLNGVSDQASLDKVLPQIKAMGLDPNGQISPVFDANNIKFVQGQAMSVKDHLETQIKQQEVENKAKELDLEMKKTYGTGGVPGAGGGKQNKINPNMDPATLINQAPVALREPVAKEIAHATNVASVSKPLIETHDQMVEALQNNKLAEYMALKKHYTQLVRTANQDITDNSAREATIQGIVDSTAPGLEAKLSGDYGNSQKAVRDWVGSVKDSPNSTNAGIDLSKYNKTRIDPNLLTMPGEKTDKMVADSIHPALKGKSLAELKKMESDLMSKQVGKK